MRLSASLAGALLLGVTACTPPVDVVGAGRAPAVTSSAAATASPPAAASVTVSPSPSATPSPTPSPTPSTPVPDRSELVARLERAVAFPDGVTASVAVLDTEGRVVFEHEGTQPVLPASTAKLAAGAGALLLFGPDHRLPTTVEAVGEVSDEGVLRGRLELVGGGDPALSTQAYRTLVYVARPHTELEALADQVAAAGITRVTQGLVAAPDAFGDTPEAPGWKDEYLAVLDARRVTALTVDAGLDLTVTKQPPNPELVLVAAEDPAGEAVARLRELLEERGVSVAGDVGQPRGGREIVATVTSPPISEHVRFALERSDNHTADTLFRLTGLGLGARDWESSGDAIARLLSAEGVDTTGMALVDGAGLSREDRVSAHTLASIDQVLRSSDLGAVWRDALAVAGEEGTLRRRLLGTVAEGRFLGKSGTLDDVTALVGTVEGPDGEAAYHVAAMATVPPGAGRFPSVLVVNDLVALLAEDAAGCTRVEPPADLPSEEPVVGGLYVDCPEPAA